MTTAAVTIAAVLAAMCLNLAWLAAAYRIERNRAECEADKAEAAARVALAKTESARERAHAETLLRLAAEERADDLAQTLDLSRRATVALAEHHDRKRVGA